MSTDKHMSVIWVGKENGVRKTVAVTPRGSKCPVPRSMLKASNNYHASSSPNDWGASGSGSQSSKNGAKPSPLMTCAPSRGNAVATSQHLDTWSRDGPDLSELADIDTSRLTELERLAIVARLYHAHELRMSGQSSRPTVRFSSAAATTTVSGETSTAEDENNIMDVDDLSDLTDLDSSYGSGSDYYEP